MHVMLVNNIYPPIMAGGAELIVSYLAEELAARGTRVSVVSTCAPEMEPYPQESRNGVDVFRFFPPNLYWSFQRDRNPGVRKLFWHMRDAWNRQAGLRFRHLLEMLRPDVLHTHVIDGFSAAIWGEARRLAIPVIHTAHDYHLLCPRAFLLDRDWKLCTDPGFSCRLYRRWHLDTGRHVDLFTSPSRFLLDRHAEAGLPSAARAVVHNGIPLPGDAQAVRAGRTPESRRRFLMMTRLTVEKGVHVVLDALRRLPKDIPIEIAIAGQGPLESDVRAAAAQDSRLTYLGFLTGDAKRDAFARAGWLLLPSLWYENAPVAIVEAAAYGLGLIGSDIGGIPEFVQIGETGLLFPPGDSSALAALIGRAAGAEPVLRDLDGRSRALAERFVVKRMTDSYQRHYADLCGAAAQAAE